MYFTVTLAGLKNIVRYIEDLLNRGVTVFLSEYAYLV